MPRCAAETKKICRFALAFAVIVAGFFSARAVPPNYFTRTWQVEQGLPQNKVTAVIQTHDGYLWVGTYNGLARFDGVRFTVFDDNNTPELRSSRVTSLFVAADGALWIGTFGGGLDRFKDGKFSVINHQQDLPNSVIGRLRQRIGKHETPAGGHRRQLRNPERAGRGNEGNFFRSTEGFGAWKIGSLGLLFFGIVIFHDMTPTQR